jgi:uncharacterized protein (TIGR03437 family)
VLSGLNATTGTVNVEVTNGALTSDPFPVTKNTATPSFFYFGSTSYNAARHEDGSLLGPASMSVPGFLFTPARSGETIVLYASGFGPTSVALTEGSSTQSGLITSAVGLTIGTKSAAVTFAGLVAPGLFQFNVVVPALTPGEAAVSIRQGTSSTVGLIPIQ